MITYLVLTGACVLVLLLLWRRDRRRRDSGRLSDMPGRGVAGEAATAMEDFARQIISVRGHGKGGEPADRPDPMSAVRRDSE